MNRYNPARFLEAVETLTPLQGRVLDALSRDEGFTVDEIARRAELGRWSPIGTRNPAIPSVEYLGPDRMTARNVLGWLASKDLAVLVEGRWYRSFSVRVNGQGDSTLSPVDPARIGSDDGRRAQGSKSSPAVLRKAA